MKISLANWKTTASAFAILLAWIIKLLFRVDIPNEVMEALTAILTFIGLFFAADAGTIEPEKKP